LEIFLKDLKFKKSDINSIFTRLDINNDGLVSYDEFKIFFNYKNYSKITSLHNEEFFHKEIKLKSGFTCNKISNLKNMNVKEKNLDKSLVYSESATSQRSQTLQYINKNSISDFSLRKNTSLEDEVVLNFFKIIIESEKKLEDLKIKLSLENDFNLVKIYHFFIQNTENEGEEIDYSKEYQVVENLSLESLKMGFNYFNSYPTEKELILIVNRYCAGKTSIK
jgi:hypothetical protein